MKMNPKNPGGEVKSGPTMKGCEFGIGKGKGSVLGGTLQTKYSLNSPGMEMKKGGHASDGKSTGSYANKSFSGSTVTGSSKANRQ